MKKYLVAAGLLACLAAQGALADEAAQRQADYAKYMKAHFYLLDEQKFSVIVCRLHAPTIDFSLASLRKQFKTLPGGLTVTANIQDFSLSYDRSKGLSFVRPSFEISSAAPGEVPDRAEIDDGIAQMRAGLDGQVSGIIAIVDGVFDNYRLSPDKAIRKFTRTKDGADVVSEQKGSVWHEVYSAKGRSADFTSQDAAGAMTGAEQAVYTETDGKKILAGSVARIKEEAGAVSTKIEIKYGKAGDIAFPASIESTTVMNAEGAPQMATIPILFEDCTAEP
jgi:hypothetical protein